MKKDIRTILLSPHSDDIAFSLGGTLLQEFFHRPLLMTTVFTRSNYSPCVKLADTEIISKVRHIEDLEFTEKLKIEFQSFNFPEAPLRGYSHRDIFMDAPIQDPIYNEVYYALSKLIKSIKCESIVSPMGLGNHIDHIIVCTICYRIAKENNINIIFYEDLPYVSKLTLKEIRARIDYINPDLQPWKINITSSFNNKIENIKLYKTQACDIKTMVRSHALYLGIENKSLKELIISYDLFKCALFFFTNKVGIPLYERIWYMY